jgi:hypothetical protein
LNGRSFVDEKRGRRMEATLGLQKRWISESVSRHPPPLTIAKRRRVAFDELFLLGDWNAAYV